MPDRSTIGGASSAHRSKAKAHRDRKAHPDGRLISDGGVPLIDGSLRVLGRSGAGIEASRPQV